MTRALLVVGHTLRSASEEMGVSYQHLANVARGRTHPRPEVIKGFEQLTGKPLKDFVSDWALAKPYDANCATKGVD